MTIPNFDALANQPGVIFKKFCTFCTESATGDLQIPEEEIRIPVCEPCAQKVLDTGLEGMVD